MAAMMYSVLYRRLTPEEAMGIPLVEVDASVVEDTYCFASNKFGQIYINRFSRLKSVFLFGPYHSVRRFSITIATHVLFEICLMAIVVANCVCLAFPELVPPGFENVFTVFYGAEIMLQTVGRGFVVGTYSYLRNPWQCLDFMITVISLSMLTVSKFFEGFETVPEIKALRGLRALKAITRIPGVQTMAQGMLLSITRMGGISIIICLFLTTITLIGKQLYMGVLLQKCVLKLPKNFSILNTTYETFVNDEENWQLDEDDNPIICGNASGAMWCDEEYVCLPNIGENPDYGYSNFDNFGWALMNCFRLLTEDAWEEMYDAVLNATGPLSVLFFIPVMFFGAFFLLNLMLAVVDSSFQSATVESDDSKRVLSNYKDMSTFHFDLNRLNLFPLPTDEKTLTRILKERDRLHKKEAIVGYGWKIVKDYVKTGSIQKMQKLQQIEEAEKLAKERLRELAEKKQGLWDKIRSKLRSLAENKYYRSLMFTCIIVNTVVLASEHYGMTPLFRTVIDRVNMVLSASFMLEESIKITGYGRKYFYDWWNVLDFLIVCEIPFSYVISQLNNISAARSLKVLRLLKVSQTWSALRKVITVILRSIVDIIKLLIVVIVMIFVFAVMGVRLLGPNYLPQVFYPDPIPRWSFVTFGRSVLTVFRIIAGEWVEPFWDCLRTGTFFKCSVIIGCYFLAGNFVIFNLFIALLLSSFDSEELQSSRKEEGEGGLKNLLRRICKKYCRYCCRCKEDENNGSQEDDDVYEGGGDISSQGKDVEEGGAKNERTKRSHNICRSYLAKFVQSTFFEGIITIMIFGSCLALSFEDANLPKMPTRRKLIVSLNVFFTGVFTIEMILKWLGLGLKQYFSDNWAIFDFIIVTVSLLEAAVTIFEIDGNFRFGALKALRALRPLRFISRWKGMQMVVTALLMSLPALFRTILVCMFIWLTFAILAVHIYAGRFFHCMNEYGEQMDADEIDNKVECLRNNLTWGNSFINFDNIGNSYLALFQLAMFTGWTEIVEMMVDVRDEKDLQPRQDESPHHYIFIMSFIIIGGFLTLNLFVGVVVDTFKEMKKHVEGGMIEMMLTDTQKRYFKAMRKMAKRKPMKIVSRPTIPLLRFFYRISDSRWFQNLMMIIICLNAVAIAVESYNEPASITAVLRFLEFVFQGIYTVEFTVKILGMRKLYFYEMWNILDFTVWLSNSLAILMETGFNQSIPIPLSVIYAFRLLRILRLVRLARGASDIQRLIFSLMASAPALFNISVLLFLLIFIYSIMGMSFFAFVRHNGVINNLVNFETLGRSSLLLFRLTSAAGWEEVLKALSIRPPKCDATYSLITNTEGDCGSKPLALIFLLSFILLSNIILINVYIAIILDNYETAIAEEREIISDDSLDDFYEYWAKYDPSATQFINISKLSHFLNGLNDSLRIEKPNSVAIAAMELPVTYANQVHCLDVLLGIVRIKVGEVEKTEEFQKHCDELNESFYKIFPCLKTTGIAATTMLLKRRDFAAKVIQKKLRKIREKKNLMVSEEDFGCLEKVSERNFRIMVHYLFGNELKNLHTPKK